MFSYCFPWLILATTVTRRLSSSTPASNDSDVNLTPTPSLSPTEATAATAAAAAAAAEDSLTTIEICTYSLPRRQYLVYYMSDLLLFYVTPLIVASALYALIARTLLGRVPRRPTITGGGRTWKARDQSHQPHLRIHQNTSDIRAPLQQDHTHRRPGGESKTYGTEAAVSSHHFTMQTNQQQQPKDVGFQQPHTVAYVTVGSRRASSSDGNSAVQVGNQLAVFVLSTSR